MKIKKIKPYIIHLGIVGFIVLFVSVIREITFSDGLKSDIEDGYRSIVIDLYNPRELVKEPNYMKVRVGKSNVKDVYLTYELLDYIAVGDSLIKIGGENVCYVKKPNGETRRFYYRTISREDRNHWTFPKEWKDKWMDSSAWDTLPPRREE